MGNQAKAGANRDTMAKKKINPSAPDTADPVTAQRDAVLLAALPDVAFDGWTPALLTRAADRAGVKPAEMAVLFPAGVHSLLAHLSDWADRAMEAALLAQPLESLRVRDRVAAGVMARLDALSPYKPAVSAALGRSLDPRLAAAVPRHVWRTADRLWWLAGDTATDWNHYSKRGLLSGVLISTTLYWLADTSAHHTDTRTFLDRRIDEVLTLGRSLGQARSWLDRIRSPFTPRRRKTPA